jgi:hypothetical protein
MINKHFMISLVCIVFMHVSVSAAQWESELVHYDGNGRLVYEPEPYTGHRIGDFSHAGYMGGGIDIPMVPTVLTISPLPGDNTTHIQ